MAPNKRSRFPLLSRTVKEPLPPVQPSVDTDDDETQDPYGFTHPTAWDAPPGFHRASQNLADLLGTSMPPSPPAPVCAPRASTSTPCLEEDSGPSEISPSTSDVHAHPSSSTHGVDAQGTPSNTGGPQLQQLGPHQVRTIDREGVIKVISVPKPSDIWRLGKDERVMIEFNTTFQPVGPGSAKLRRIAGMLIRSGHFACLEVKDWRTVDPQPKEDIWTILMTKFYVETDQQLSEIKKVTFQDLGRKRKDFKYGIKQSLKLKEYRTPNQVIEATPKTNIISPKTLEVLVEQWFTEDDMKRAEKNKKSRGEQKFSHSSGSKSFARLAKERETTSGYPNRSQLFMVTHVKKDGTPVNDVAAAKMAQMKEIMAEGGPTSTLCAHGSISWAPNDPYSQVMGPERPGRVRGVGLGLTPGRGRYNCSGASTSANQPHLVSQVNKLEAEIGQMRTQHQDEMCQMRTDHQNEMIQMRKIMLELVRAGPAPNIPGTTSRGDIADKDDEQVGDKGGGEGTRK